MRKAIVLHDTFRENCLVDWSYKNLGVVCTDPEKIEDFKKKLLYCSQFASRQREYKLNKIKEALGLTDDQVEIIDSPHMFVAEDGRYFDCAQDASKGKKFLRYSRSEKELCVFEGKGNEDWNCAAPSTVYTDSIPSANKYTRITNEQFTKDIEPTGTLVEKCEIINL